MKKYILSATIIAAVTLAGCSELDGSEEDSAVQNSVEDSGTLYNQPNAATDNNTNNSSNTANKEGSVLEGGRNTDHVPGNTMGTVIEDTTKKK